MRSGKLELDWVSASSMGALALAIALSLPGVQVARADAPDASYERPLPSQASALPAAPGPSCQVQEPAGPPSEAVIARVRTHIERRTEPDSQADQVVTLNAGGHNYVTPRVDLRQVEREAGEIAR